MASVGTILKPPSLEADVSLALRPESPPFQFPHHYTTVQATASSDSDHDQCDSIPSVETRNV